MARPPTTRPLAAPHPRDLGATRFWARIQALDLECPRCGKVFRLRTARASRLRPVRLGVRHVWHPATQTFTCAGRDGCLKQFRLGVLAWEPPRGKRAGAVAEDLIPSPRELAQLRAEGEGWWMPAGLQGTGQMDMQNWAATDERPEEED